MKQSLAFLALAAALSIAAPARADIVYTFASSTFNGPLGDEQDYTSGGYTIKTYGFHSTLSSGPSLALGSPTDLYAKYTSGDPGETGLGIKHDPTGDHEITSATTVKVDISALTSADGNAPVKFTIGSVQSGESFDIFGGASGPTTFLGSVTGSGSNTIYDFTATSAQVAASGGVFYVTAGNEDVLLNSIGTSAVPEPASIIMAMTGLAMVGGFGWLRRRARA
jgi:PEP-CTERM motif